MSLRGKADSPDFDDFRKAVGSLVLVVTGIAIHFAAEGFVTKLVWNWFIPHVFPQAPRLSLAEALGLAITASVFFTQDKAWSKIEQEGNETTTFDRYQGIALKLGTILLSAWVVHRFFL